MLAAYNARGSFVMLASAEEEEDRSIGGREGGREHWLAMA